MTNSKPKPIHPNSVGYWRENSIQAFRMEMNALTAEYNFPDPEAKERFHQLEAELAILLEQRKRVIDRYKRIFHLRDVTDRKLHTRTGAISA